jgi:hypothetical protein
MNISKAKPDDAEALVDLFNRLGHETDFMLFEPEERNITVEEEALNRFYSAGPAPSLSCRFGSVAD